MYILYFRMNFNTHICRVSQISSQKPEHLSVLWLRTALVSWLWHIASRLNGFLLISCETTLVASLCLSSPWHYELAFSLAHNHTCWRDCWRVPRLILTMTERSTVASISRPCQKWEHSCQVRNVHFVSYSSEWWKWAEREKRSCTWTKRATDRCADTDAQRGKIK